MVSIGLYRFHEAKDCYDKIIFPVGSQTSHTCTMPKRIAHPFVDLTLYQRGMSDVCRVVGTACAILALLAVGGMPAQAMQDDPPTPPAQTQPTQQPEPKIESVPTTAPKTAPKAEPKAKPQPTKPQADTLDSMLSALLSDQTEATQRGEIADQLLTRAASDSAAGAALAALLAQANNPDNTNAGALLLDQIAQRITAPVALEAPIIALSKEKKSNAGLRYKALVALGTYRTRQAAAALVVALSDPDDTITTQAYLSLERLTGHDDFAREPGAWQQWLSSVLEISEQAWSEELLRARMAQVERLRTRLAQDNQYLTEAWRKVHLLTPIDERSDLLAELLQSDVAVLQNLGFELLNREISESRTLKPIVAQAAIALLTHPDPQVRARAAILLHRLAPASAQGPVYAALSAESDSTAAQALLLAATRWPSTLGRGPILRWLTGPVDVRLRAAGLAWELLRSEQLPDQADREQLLRGVRSIPNVQLTAPACRILATLGQAEDLTRLEAMLKAEEPAVRTMAADALALRADQVSVLLAHATNDPTLYEPTARAVQAHMHDAQGYAALAALPAPSPQVRDRVLSRFAALLPTQELVRLAKLVDDPAEAIHLLAPLTAKERLDDPAQSAALTQGLLMLAQVHMAMGNPSQGLNALSLIPVAQPAKKAPESTNAQSTTPSPNPDPDPAAATDAQATADPPVDVRTRINELRVIFLLWLNRLDQAQAIDASADAWLTALEHILKESYAAPIADAFKTRFGTTLTKAQQQRFAAIQASLKAQTKQATSDAAPPVPAPEAAPTPANTPPDTTPPDKGGTQIPPPKDEDGG